MTSEPEASPKTAELRIGARTFSLPMERGSEGYPAINVNTLLRDAGVVTLDYGFGSTANTRSAITYLDGEAGILRYRGYPIEQLAEHSSFMEVSAFIVIMFVLVLRPTGLLSFGKLRQV